MSEVNWYVVHTYSGYENKVKANIEKTIENRHLEDQILEVRVPMEEVVEVKNGTKKQVLRKLFPGYVLINMICSSASWKRPSAAAAWHCSGRHSRGADADQPGAGADFRITEVPRGGVRHSAGGSECVLYLYL